MPKTPQAPDVQGEGNVDADRRYRESAQGFVEAGKVKPAGDQAAPRSAEEAQGRLDAERAGRAHARK